MEEKTYEKTMADGTVVTVVGQKMDVGLPDMEEEMWSVCVYINTPDRQSNDFVETWQEKFGLLHKSRASYGEFVALADEMYSASVEG